MITALPTVYHGTTFRSRLEADWAATLNDRRIDWQYEPEGYALSDGTWYSPDFWIPASKAWLEVKGSHMLGVSKVEQFAADLWREYLAGLADADKRNPFDVPLVLLGREPTSYGGPDETMSVIGIRAPGHRYSLDLRECGLCGITVFAALQWPYPCRACRRFDETDNGRDNHYEQIMRPFVRLPRPAGGSTR